MTHLASHAGLSDAIVINSCAVTGEAVRRTRQAIRRAHRDHPQRKLIITGCAAQIDPASFGAMPEVDAVLGNTEKLLPETWRTLAHETDTQPENKTPMLSVSNIMAVQKTPPLSTYQQPVARARAYVQIQNGCDHRCTFCIIPFGRGNSRSVPPAEILAEIASLVAQGLKEVVLTGVDITSYGADLPATPSLGSLVRRILTDNPALPRLRLSSIDGAEIDDLLFTLITQEKRLVPHLHLSLQAGDNMILKRMKRRHTREQAIAFCRAVKQHRPAMTFGADIIAGFPTETEEMFAKSLALVSDCTLTYLHVFPFSPRQDTPAARMPQVPRAVIKERAARLRRKGDAALAQHLIGFIGQTVSVLTEKAPTPKANTNPSNKEQSKDARGRLANFTEVSFDSIDDITLRQPGHLCQITITGHDGQRLLGHKTEKRKA